MESNPTHQRPLVGVLTLTWNSEGSIERCLRGVARQTYPYLEVITTDNNSKDRTREIIENLRSLFTGDRSLRTDWQGSNLGYGAGRNSGIRLAQGQYVLCLNDDVKLEDDFIEQAVRTMEDDETIGAVQGKLLGSSKQQAASSKIIDTVGLKAFKSRKFANRGHGEEDQGQYEKEEEATARSGGADKGASATEEVFGVDGAAPLYRRSALEEIRIPSTNYKLQTTNYEYFDPDFFLYKEDIDLSWRLRLAGWKIVYQPKARAMNTRTSKTGLNFLEARFQTSRRVRYFSFRNHHFLMLKNDGGWFFFAHLPWILGRELGYLTMSLFFELGNIVAVGDIIRLFPRMLRKRRVIMKNRKVKRSEIYKWFQ